MSAASRKTETLRTIALFKTLGPVEIERLDTQCIWRSVRAGQWILDYQEETDDVIFVVHGTVSVKIQSVGGRQVLLRELTTGEYFGELAGFDGYPRSSGIVAITDGVIARMPKQVFRAVIHAHPDTCDQVLTTLARQIRMLSNRVNEFSNLDVRHRIYAELLRLSRARSPKSKSRIISPPPLHADIAARISTRREAVAREIKLLERNGLIIRHKGSLELPDPDAVRCLIEEILTE
jgi:CRP/FNR family cyclic AMP-dependent transcriptional regulator